MVSDVLATQRKRTSSLPSHNSAALVLPVAPTPPAITLGCRSQRWLSHTVPVPSTLQSASSSHGKKHAELAADESLAAASTDAPHTPACGRHSTPPRPSTEQSALEEQDAVHTPHSQLPAPQSR